MIEQSPLAEFHPLIQQWFRDKYSSPTDAQAQAWPKIASGEHVLVTAPTGSGKTLTAFLSALDGLICGQAAPGRTRVLYVSPLKALNNDIQRNLLSPLRELEEVFTQANEPFPKIRALTRSGDTDAATRQRMIRRPPEILITTPESLNLMLSSAGGRQALQGIETLILDEIHAVFDSKRGTHLIMAIERLVALTGDFQRIALSATINPLDAVARFVGGYTLDGRAREVAIVEARDERRYNLQVRYLEPHENTGEQDGFFIPLVESLKETAEKNRSTLFFVNSRRLCEKLTFKVNSGETEPLAFAHHGSLAREIRAEVERRLKAGELRAIIATSSLELGIDIGALDEVVMIQVPPSVAAATQRLGRAGHQVGASSHGKIHPLIPREIAEALVLAEAVPGGDLEPVQAIENPLDVLAQTIISMTGTETWAIDDLYRQIVTAYPFHALDRAVFDGVLQMLAGRFADSRIRELQPRISIDGLEQTVTARKGALLALYSSGGVIPDRGYFQLRHDDSGARIGELDEEFVWEARIGQVLTLGTQSWKIRKITHNDVYVVPAGANTGAPPFWISEQGQRDYHLAHRIARFLEEAQHATDENQLDAMLEARAVLDPLTAEHLGDFLKKQQLESGCALPHANHLLIEHVEAGPGGAPGFQTIIHTLWGGRVNQPFALALEAAWDARFNHELRVSVSDYSVILVMSEAVSGEEIVSLIDEAELESLLRTRLEASGFFGARFRECAAVSLLIPRRKIGERLPLWVSRLRSQKLLEAVKTYPDFPILLETWRSCLKDEFDLPHLRERLTAIRSGLLPWTEIRTSTATPMAQGDAWRQINEYMYMDDQSRSAVPSQLSDELIADIINDPHLRPTLTAELIAEFEARRQRTLPGYAPMDEGELLDWVKERVLLSATEALALQEQGGMPCSPAEHEKLTQLESALFVARERKDEVTEGLYGEDEIAFTRLLGEWLSFYGPKSTQKIAVLLNLPEERIVAFASGNETVVTDLTIEGSDTPLICDRTNYEILLRMARRAAQPQLTAKPITALPHFLARWQKLGRADSDDIDALRTHLEMLTFYPAKAAAWERDILPARIPNYDPSWLDAICQERAMQWIGCPTQSLFFAFNNELDLGPATVSHDTTLELLPDPQAGYAWTGLQQRLPKADSPAVERLWNLVWDGQINNDSFATIRSGLQQKFTAPDMGDAVATARRQGRASRAGRRRWESSHQSPGTWRRIDYPEHSDNLLDKQELNRQRVRILFDRYGIVFRELLLRELPEFRWASLFRALRLMELSGEILSGHFFEGVPGLQFATAKSLQVFQQKEKRPTIFWLNACDPISPCGLDISALKQTTPNRLAGNHVVYRGEELIITSENHAKKLHIHIAADDPDLPQAFAFMHHLLRREAAPRRRISIEEINGLPAANSEYVPMLKACFDLVIEHKLVNVHARIN